VTLHLISTFHLTSNLKSSVTLQMRIYAFLIMDTEVLLVIW